jgi:hypothetical protein
MTVGPYRIVALAELPGVLDSTVVKEGLETVRTRKIRVLLDQADTPVTLECSASTWHRTTRGVFEGSSWEWLSTNSQRSGSLKCGSGGTGPRAEILFDGDSISGRIQGQPDLELAPVYAENAPKLLFRVPPGMLFLRQGNAVAFAELRRDGMVLMDDSLAPEMKILIAGALAIMVECPGLLVSQAAEACGSGAFP